jgi:SAM-dependent methyltransferase
MKRHGHQCAQWLDDQQPHDAARSQAQIAGVLRKFRRQRRRILDLGCGTGRVLAPLCEAGHEVTGIDADRKALGACKAALQAKNLRASLKRADFNRSFARLVRFHAVILLGNTFMTLVDVEAALKLLERVRRSLLPRGAFLIDDFPQELWPEVHSGNWVTGISSDGQQQMIWREGEPVFALRQGLQVDVESWSIKRSDRLFRLWTMGELRLLARIAGLSAPVHEPKHGLIVLRRP